jgi:hypothetical protein
MNRPEIVAALKAALNPETEAYKEASRKYGDLARDQADQRRAMELAIPLATVLAEQPEYDRCPHMMLQTGSGARITFRPDRAAQLLVLNATKSDADTAVNWLADLLEKGRASGLQVMPLWQLAVDAPLAALTKDVDLIPFSMLPPSGARAWLEGRVDRGSGHWMLPGPLLGMQQPTAALTTRKVIDPLFVDAEEELWPDPDPVPNMLDDIRLCLSAIGPHPILGPLQWFQFDDPDLNVAAGTGIGGMPLEIMPAWLTPPVTFDADGARAFVAQLLSLPAKIRRQARIALRRLVQAMLRREPGDKAADLSIALEALLVGEGGEHTWKVSTRAGILTGWDFPSKLDRRNVISAAYRMRSSLVHSGAASSMINVAGRGQQAGDAICEEAARICAAVIRAIIERGGIPDWAAFDVSGGLCGWPKLSQRRKV